MSREGFLMDLFAAGGACLLLERALSPMWFFWAMPLLMLIDALPGHLLRAILACAPVFECWLGGPVPAPPTLLRVIAVAMTAHHFLYPARRCVDHIEKIVKNQVAEDAGMVDASNLEAFCSSLQPCSANGAAWGSGRRRDGLAPGRCALWKHMRLLK